ncbi:hypothetical protein SAMN00790413_05761 [Deinococcus hopiensis KR-140]|uniref:Uncharacterized protein n=1 Tax=Deinococcus hopiensis KR-140 TaxID=695939 RepID=A0A1W1UE56_9DEIO|nr:hypothetical protein SAMN00790413_05761 [Deinococcus hopiensis KR-140]
MWIRQIPSQGLPVPLSFGSNATLASAVYAVRSSSVVSTRDATRFVIRIPVGPGDLRKLVPLRLVRSENITLDTAPGFQERSSPAAAWTNDSLARRGVGFVEFDAATLDPVSEQLFVVVRFD